MDVPRLAELLAPYNPWHGGDTAWRKGSPQFERPIVEQVLSDLRELPHIVSVTGPRRVGKSTALRQVVAHLLDEDIEDQRIVYFSFDDPALFVDPARQRRIFDELIAAFVRPDRLVYFFLDEI